MAFAGVHFEFGYQKKGTANPSPVLGPITASETQTSTFTATTKAAPAINAQGDPAINVLAVADGYVSFGQPPGDPSVITTTRRAVQAGTPICFLVEPGDRVWYAAA